MLKTIVSVCSARPNFVKLAAVHHALEKHPEFRHVIVHTGQHYDPLLSDIFFSQLHIPQPTVNLGIHAPDRDKVIKATNEAIIPVLKEYQPVCVLVYGDVNGAVGGARAALELKIPIAHVEAGLRSFDREMPEEHNRIEIDKLADFLFCTEQSGVNHLEKEKAKGEVHLVGNTMIDTLIRMLPEIEKAELDLEPPENYVVATLHRPSNVDNRNNLIDVTLSFLSKINKIVPIILPMHPRFRKIIEQVDPERTTVPLLSISYPIDPLGYLPFLKLMKSAKFILTDSGGIQEEAVFLGKKCFTLRRNTERPSTIESGSNTLIDPSVREDRDRVLDFAKNPVQPKITIPPLWDGEAGKRIVDILAEKL
jgi:UDP-N-acetylglucosamine 2-epimerase (non-hydrolysing)